MVTKRAIKSASLTVNPSQNIYDAVTLICFWSVFSTCFAESSHMSTMLWVMSPNLLREIHRASAMASTGIWWFSRIMTCATSALSSVVMEVNCPDQGSFATLKSPAPNLGNHIFLMPHYEFPPLLCLKKKNFMTAYASILPKSTVVAATMKKRQRFIVYQWSYFPCKSNRSTIS